MFPTHDGYLKEFCLPVLSLRFASSLRGVSLFFPVLSLCTAFAPAVLCLCSSCGFLVTT